MRRPKNQRDLEAQEIDVEKIKIKERRCLLCWIWPFFAAFLGHAVTTVIYPLVFISPVPSTPLISQTSGTILDSTNPEPKLLDQNWLANIFESVTSTKEMLVHSPFFWKALLDIADVRIGNWNKASKGFAKVLDRSHLWNELQEWEMDHPGKVSIVFAKCSLCTLLAANRSNIHGPYIIMGTFNDNWGMLSHGRAGIHQMQSLENLQDPRCGGSIAQLEAFLADPRLLLWVVNHHVFRPLKQVISLPLGIQDKLVWDSAALIAKNPPQRSKLLEVNNNDWRFRAALNAAVNQSFGYSLVNSYNASFKGGVSLTGADRKHIRLTYLSSLARAQFVLCPPGLGMDSYRVYEALLMGSIPVIEYSPGLDRTLAQLPVLVLRNLSHLSPDLLHHVQALPLSALLMSTGFQQTKTSKVAWDFGKLTSRYWTSMITNVKLTKRIDDGWVQQSDGMCSWWFPPGNCLNFTRARPNGVWT